MENDIRNSISSVIFVTIGIAMIMVMLIFTSTLNGSIFENQQTVIQSIGVTQVSDKAFNSSNTIWRTLSGGPVVNTSMRWSVENATGVDKTSYCSMNLTTGKIKGRNATLNGQTLYATYEYGNETNRVAIMDSIIGAFRANTELAGYTPMVALAVVIVIILGIIFMAFAPSGGTGPGRPGSGLELL